MDAPKLAQCIYCGNKKLSQDNDGKVFCERCGAEGPDPIIFTDIFMQHGSINKTTLGAILWNSADMDGERPLIHSRRGCPCCGEKWWFRFKIHMVVNLSSRSGIYTVYTNAFLDCYEAEHIEPFIDSRNHNTGDDIDTNDVDLCLSCNTTITMNNFGAEYDD